MTLTPYCFVPKKASGDLSAPMAQVSGSNRVLSSSWFVSPIQSVMRGEGLLRTVCILLIAAGAISCGLEVEVAQPAQKARKVARDVEVRQSPLSRPPARNDTRGSDQVGICDPASSPVIIVVVETPKQVKSASAQWKTTPIVVEKPETVVFADGRIVTSRVEAMGDQLQSLGWTHRQIEIVGGLPAASGAWQRRRG